MPYYQLVPTSGETPLEVVASDASALLHIADRHCIREADVYQDSEYQFTIRHSGAMASCWTIETRPADQRQPSAVG